MVSIKNLKVKQLLKDLPTSEGFLIAYSGGADSTALLHLFAKVPKVRAIHINHGIQAQAMFWQNHCVNTCKKLNIPLIIEQANLSDSSENSCRIARYTFFEKQLKTNEILLTAHHAQDQAETVLLKLLRGTGAKGLSGIDKIRKFSNGYLVRPLLDYSSDTLRFYLTENKINWVEDNSNQDNNYKRNFIRNKIIPLLQSITPDVIGNISRSASNAKQSLLLTETLINFKDKTLALESLTDLPNELRSTLFYHWLSSKNLPVPDKKSLQQITHDFINASNDKNPHYINNFYQLFRWKNKIHCILNYELIKPEKHYNWNTKDDFILPNNCGTLTYKGNRNFNLTIRFNQTGHKLKPLKKQHTKSIKNLFQENNIPVWERQNTPYIFLNDSLISLGYSWSHNKKTLSNLDFNLINFIL